MLRNRIDSNFWGEQKSGQINSAWSRKERAKAERSPGDIAFPVAPAHKLALEPTGTPGLSLGQTCKDLVRIWQILEIDSYLVKTVMP